MLPKVVLVLTNSSLSTPDSASTVKSSHIFLFASFHNSINIQTNNNNNNNTIGIGFLEDIGGGVSESEMAREVAIDGTLVGGLDDEVVPSFLLDGHCLQVHMLLSQSCLFVISSSDAFLYY